MVTAMRKGELLAMEIGPLPIDFNYFSHEDEFPAEWILNDKNGNAGLFFEYMERITKAHDFLCQFNATVKDKEDVYRQLRF